MKQHYVPEFLLRNFCRPGEKHLFAYDKFARREFRVSTRDAAAQNGFYDFEISGEKFTIEAELADLESNAAKIIRLLIEKRSIRAISENQKKTLAHFCCVQMLRTPGHRELERDSIVRLREKIIASGADPTKVKGLPNLTCDETNTLNIHLLSIAAKLAPALLSDKCWVLQIAPKNVFLQISDNPLARHNERSFDFYGNLGLMSPGIEINLPLTSELNLWITCSSNAKPFIEAQEGALRAGTLRKGLLTSIINALAGRSLFELRQGNVDRLNSIQAAQAERYIYSRDGNFSIAKKTTLRFPSGPRMVVG